MPRIPGPGPPPDIKPYRPHPLGGGLLAKKCCCGSGGGGDCPTWNVPPCHDHMRLIHTQFKAISPYSYYPDFYCVHEVALQVRMPFDPLAHIYRCVNASQHIVYMTDYVQRWIDGVLEAEFWVEYPQFRFWPGSYPRDLTCDLHNGRPHNLLRHKVYVQHDYAPYCYHNFGGMWWQADPVSPGEECPRAGQYTDYEEWTDPDVLILNPGNVIILDPA